MALDELFARLSASKFRAKFKLGAKEKRYLEEKGIDAIRQHARDFIAARLAPAHPANDGKQTPMRGHPVFIAQHATATCCRGCLAKWHRIEKDLALSKDQQDFIVGVIMEWIARQGAGDSRQSNLFD